MLATTWTQVGKSVCSDICSSVCYVGQLGVSDLILYKTLLKISVQFPSSLSHVVLSVLISTREQSPLLGAQSVTHTQAQDDLQAGTESDSD